MRTGIGICGFTRNLIKFRGRRRNCGREGGTSPLVERQAILTRPQRSEGRYSLAAQGWHTNVSTVKTLYRPVAMKKTMDRRFGRRLLAELLGAGHCYFGKLHFSKPFLDKRP